MHLIDLLLVGIISLIVCKLYAVGLFAIPEIIAGLRNKALTDYTFGHTTGQTKQAFVEVWKNRWLSLRGGFIGAVVGLLAGLGGAIADWIAYGQTVATM